jgi:UDP-N-acetylbacillosamine N-acetyltransferase
MAGEEIVIYGAGGHARSVADVLLAKSSDISIIFVDGNAQPGEKIYGFDVVAEIEPDSDKHYFVAIGDNEKRRAIRESLGSLATMSVIATDAHLGKDSVIEPGAFIGHETYIGPLARVGEGSIINTRAIIEHEVQIGINSQVGPGAIIGGRAIIGDRVLIGLGARIIDSIAICSNTVIGAAATVVDSIPSPGTYVGTPARNISE